MSSVCQKKSYGESSSIYPIRDNLDHFVDVNKMVLRAGTFEASVDVQDGVYGKSLPVFQFGGFLDQFVDVNKMIGIGGAVA